MAPEEIRLRCLEFAMKMTNRDGYIISHAKNFEAYVTGKPVATDDPAKPASTKPNVGQPQSRPRQTAGKTAGKAPVKA